MKTIIYKAAIKILIFTMAVSLNETFAQNSDNFFVKEQNNAQSSISAYTSADAVKEILIETPWSKVNYIEHVFEDKTSPFHQVVVKNNNGKNYLHWIVKNDSKQGIFILERSENGIDFCALGFKDRVNSAIEHLCYYFTDELPLSSETMYYRVLAMGEDGSYSYSEIVKVENSIGKKYTQLYY